MGQSRLLGLLEAVLFAAGFFHLGYWVHGWNETRIFQQKASRALDV